MKQPTRSPTPALASGAATRLGTGSALAARPVHRRGWIAAALSATLLAACQTPVPAPASPPIPPTPPVDRIAIRNAELQRLGFVRKDDTWEFLLPGKLLFDVASDQIDPESQATAERIGVGLLKLGIEKLRVEGHTDNVGSAPFNLTLSLRRAQAVARALASKGLPSEFIEVRGYGMDKPVVDNGTPEGRAQNRRVAVVIPAF